jgi:hypothetical protein
MGLKDCEFHPSIEVKMAMNRRQLLLGLGASGVGMAVAQVGQRSIAQTAGESLLTQQTLLAQQTGVNPPGDIRLVVISDLNSSYGSVDYEPEVDRIISLLPQWKPDLVLCAGDMVAGQYPSLTRAQMQAMWQGWDKHVTVPLRRAKIPFAFTVGNHDASGALGIGGRFLFGQERDVAAAYWRAPRQQLGLNFIDRSGFPFYYSFEQKGIFYLVWDASTAIIPPAQVVWAQKSLATPAAQNAKQRIVLGHLPLYAVAIGRDDPGDFLNNADSLRAMLERANVNLYISGHHHAYYPGQVGKLQTLQCGLLGSGARPLLVGNQRPRKTVTLIDYEANRQQLLYTTLDARTMQPIALNSLPRLIPGPNGTILRRDVRLADLTPAERALRYTPSN